MKQHIEDIDAKGLSKRSFAIVTKYDPLREQVEDLLFEELGHKITGSEAATITEKILDCLRDKLADVTDG